MLDKIGKIVTPMMFGYGMGYFVENYKWNKAWDKQVKIVRDICKDIIID